MVLSEGSTSHEYDFEDDDDDEEDDITDGTVANFVLPSITHVIDVKKANNNHSYQTVVKRC